jgi:hypothetical protein
LQRIIAIMLVAVLWIVVGCAATGTPRDSLSQLRTALLNHDADAALRYIDVDSITDHLAEDALNRYETSGDALTSLGAMVGRNMQPLLLPLAKEAIRQRVRRAISSTDDNEYFGYIRKAHVFFLTVSMEGDSKAFVEPKGKSDFAFRMAKTEQGYWKIVELILHKNEKR